MTKISTVTAAFFIAMSSACGMSTLEAKQSKNGNPSAPTTLVEDNDAGVEEPSGNDNDNAVVAPAPVVEAQAGS